MGNVGILTHVRVDAVQAAMLGFIGGRSGEISWDWRRCADRPDVVQMMRSLIDKGLVVELVAERRIRLTDQGRSALSQIEEAKKKRAVIG